MEFSTNRLELHRKSEMAFKFSTVELSTGARGLHVSSTRGVFYSHHLFACIFCVVFRWATVQGNVSEAFDMDDKNGYIPLP